MFFSFWNFQFSNFWSSVGFRRKNPGFWCKNPRILTLGAFGGRRPTRIMIFYMIFNLFLMVSKHILNVFYSIFNF